MRSALESPLRPITHHSPRRPPVRRAQLCLSATVSCARAAQSVGTVGVGKRSARVAQCDTAEWVAQFGGAVQA